MPTERAEGRMKKEESLQFTPTVILNHAPCMRWTVQDDNASEV